MSFETNFHRNDDTFDQSSSQHAFISRSIYSLINITVVSRFMSSIIRWSTPLSFPNSFTIQAKYPPQIDWVIECDVSKFILHHFYMDRFLDQCQLVNPISYEKFLTTTTINSKINSNWHSKYTKFVLFCWFWSRGFNFIFVIPLKFSVLINYTNYKLIYASQKSNI